VTPWRDHEKELIASSVEVKDRMVHLRLLDGSTHAFPVSYSPLLAGASDGDLESVQLRVGGRALRWETLDEDIWIQDAVLQNYPRPTNMSVAEPPPSYPA
jgi:hypothetical protein